MKRVIFAVIFCFTAVLSAFSQMSDSEVVDFIARERKAGTSQAQIVTKLTQRGVQIEQIRRLRSQYNSRIRKENSAYGTTARSDEEETTPSRTGTTIQDFTTARHDGQENIYANAEEEHSQYERDVEFMQGTSGEAEGKKVFGRDVFSRTGVSFEPNMI